MSTRVFFFCRTARSWNAHQVYWDKLPGICWLHAIFRSLIFSLFVSARLFVVAAGSFVFG